MMGFAEIRQLRFLYVGIGFLVVFGLFRADATEGFIAYGLITGASVLPALLWLRAGAPGIPILPVFGAFHYLYFAVPVLRENSGVGSYSPIEILRAAFTVSLFLIVATLAWRLILRSSSRRNAVKEVSADASGLGLMFGGLILGVLFQLAIISGWLDWVGSLWGVIRAIALTVASIACYLLGHLRAQRLLRGQAWGLALGGMILMVILSLSSLFLVGGMQFVMAAMLGYAISAKRLPWVALATTMIALFVLHAGKAEMRARYWIQGNPLAITLMQVPELFGEWAGNGIKAIVSGEVQQDIVDRASLLYMLLRVQQVTPEYIPYLGGETYALLPTYLVPRFLSPNKAMSQAGLTLLNIRYGLQTRETANSTTIGWGVISEAFANFGYAGVLGAGVVFGALAALFTRSSAGASPLALPTLLSITALVTLINLEADFGYLITNLWQALAATAIFFVPLKYLSRNVARGPTSRPAVI